MMSTAGEIDATAFVAFEAGWDRRVSAYDHFFAPIPSRANRHADGKGVTELDSWKLGGRVVDQSEVACFEGPLEAGVCRSLAYHRACLARPKYG